VDVSRARGRGGQDQNRDQAETEQGSLHGAEPTSVEARSPPHSS
jgi:hypothetical protein